MKLKTNTMDGAKVLYRVPSYIDAKDVKNGDSIIEMGTLSNFKRYMKLHYNHEGVWNSSMREGDGSSWSGARSFDDYLNILENGDEAVMKKIKIDTNKKVAELGKKHEEVLTNYKFDVTGELFDIGLVLTGVPEAWLTPEYEEEEKVQVELVINGTFHSGINQKDVVNGASRILAMTKILEDHGVEIKIKIVSCVKNYNSKNNAFVATEIKDYDEPINYKKVSALLSPTYLRRGVFKVLEVLAPKTLWGNYGKPMNQDHMIAIHDTNQINKLEKKLFTRGVK